MNRNELGKHRREHGQWMRPSERIVFLILLERSDNADCTIPAFMTLSLAELADSAGYTISAAAEALTHLERHGWLTRTRSKGGKGHKTSYRLAAGGQCAATSPAVCLRPPKQSGGAECLASKQSDGADLKQSDEPSENRRSVPVSDEGINEGGKVNRDRPDWPLIRQIIRAVHTAPGGGLHRGELADLVHLPAYGKAFKTALFIAYRKREIDFCGRYVVRPRS